MSSHRYRFSGPFAARMMGLALVALGVVVVLLVVLVALLPAPDGVLTTVLVAAAVLVVLVGVLATRRPTVVRLDDAGYRIRFVRGAGVRQAAWRDVEDAEAVVVAGERCVVLRLRDGRTSVVPVGVLAGRPEDFVRDLQQHLDRGHGYRRLSG